MTQQALLTKLDSLITEAERTHQPHHFRLVFAYGSC